MSLAVTGMNQNVLVGTDVVDEKSIRALSKYSKVYKLADQDKVTAHAGHKVTITGKMEGDTIKVDSVKM